MEDPPFAEGWELVVFRPRAPTANLDSNMLCFASFLKSYSVFSAYFGVLDIFGVLRRQGFFVCVRFGHKSKIDRVQHSPIIFTDCNKSNANAAIRFCV